MKQHVVVLGAGFGGLELSTCLSESVADDVRVTLIDQSDSFVFGFSKLDILFGRKRRDDVRLRYADLAHDAVEFRQERVTSIDPTTRHVVTDGAEYDADILVVALGADYDPGATPGFVEGGFEFYSVAGAERLWERLGSFDGGSVVIGILGGSFKCPPAPFEGAFLLHEYLTGRGLRDRTTIRMTSTLPSPIPVSAETSGAIVAALSERGIEATFGRRVVSIDPAAKTAHLAGGETIPYDLFIGIPVHRVPEVVEASGLTAGNPDGWVTVDPRNLRTPFDGVYAIGDVAGAPVPRAGVFAERAAQVVAADIASRIRATDPPEPYDGAGVCYIEFGGGLVGRVDANFLGGPTPVAPLTAPSAEFAEQKRAFAAGHRERWFGR